MRSMHRAAFSAALTLLPVLSLPAQEPPPRLDDIVAYTATTLRLRAEPFTTARVLAILAPGTAVRTYTCSDGWCSVHVPIARRSGHVASRYLTLQPPPAAPTGRGYVNVDGVWVPSPQRTIDSEPPDGATAQCRDGTFSFSQHRRGTCSWHGGVARWLRP